MLRAIAIVSIFDKLECTLCRGSNFGSKHGSLSSDWVDNQSRDADYNCRQDYHFIRSATVFIAHSDID